jgi:ADP-L-glycero-D-manno-heptose 6-epimerase
MIIITGAAGFIASALVGHFNSKGIKDIIIVDDFSNLNKTSNWTNKQYAHLIERELFFDWISQQNFKITAIYHIGAKTDTTLFDIAIFEKLNIDYSKKMWALAIANQATFIYASSAATYGNGAWGYHDDHTNIHHLQPLNPYGHSKHQFDLWALAQQEKPINWYGLKFFNVYGPNEYHKARMASVIFHAYHQIKKTGTVNLFESHKLEYENGGQLRDFVYVKDVIAVIDFLTISLPENGIYNLGTGKAQSFNDLVLAIFSALDLYPIINYIPTPIDIRDSYQYYTQANMQKLVQAGYFKQFFDLQTGVSDYVLNYLENKQYL